MRESAPRTIHERPVLGFKDGQAGVEEIGPGDNDHVEARCNLVPTEYFTQQPFGAVPLDGAAQFLRRGDAQAAVRLLVGQEEQGSEPAADADAALVYALEIGASADALMRPETLIHAGSGAFTRC